MPSLLRRLQVHATSSMAGPITPSWVLHAKLEIGLACSWFVTHVPVRFILFGFLLETTMVIFDEPVLVTAS